MHRVAHSLAGGEVDDALDAGILVEEGADGGHVGAVGLHEVGTYAGDALYAVEHIFVGVGEVIYDHYRVAGLLQLYHGV